jgi:alpha-1,3-mannosyltransferase
MDEVDGWLGGELDYAKLRGGTGPLVYPAGFLYIYAALRWLVGGGGRGPAAIAAAQWLFLGLYLAALAAVLRVYEFAAGRRGGSSGGSGGGGGSSGGGSSIIATTFGRTPPPWLALLLPLSKRLHSLYVLRLFNDCWSAALLWAALALLAERRWAAGIAAWSAAVSVKMNGLLWLPALGLLLLRNVGVARTAALLAGAGALQAALGAPFLLGPAPRAYLARAFELDRVFFHNWTVNWAFIPRAVFVSRGWALALLGAHLAALLALAHFSWSARTRGGLFGVLRAIAAREAAAWRGARGTPRGAFADAPAYIVHVLLAAQFAGVVFARTLHYQFYAWYAQSLPLLGWAAGLPAPALVAALGAIEWAFNVGDARGAGTPASSGALAAAHAVLLGGLVLFARPADGAAGGAEAEARAPRRAATPARAPSPAGGAAARGAARPAARRAGRATSRAGSRVRA